jgi:hypothetical protein
MARTRGYARVFKKNISQVLGIGMGTVNYHWKTMAALRAAIVHDAIRNGDKDIITQAVVNRDPVLWRKNLSATLRTKLDELGVSSPA